MLCVVGVVGLCVHVFSLGYMRDDSAKSRYFGGLSIFMFSMTGIVLADNLFMMFIFWELVGFSSYFLIGHWNARQSAADAAKKAFIVNRVGDFGFLLGIILCYWTNGTVNLSALGGGPRGARGLQQADPAAPLLRRGGQVGAAAPPGLAARRDGGPDPGLRPDPRGDDGGGGRLHALPHQRPDGAAGVGVIAWVGTLTALYAALCAVTQRDIKKVLAYSTLSQLGYMVAGRSARARSARRCST